MTSAQQNQLNDLFQTYLDKKAIYDIELGDNYNAHTYNTGNAAASDASLAVKRQSMNNALAAYNLLKDDITASDLAAFVAANPEQAVNVIAAQTEATIKGEAAAASTRSASETAASDAALKRNLYIGGAIIVALIIGLVVFVWYKNKSKKIN